MSEPVGEKKQENECGISQVENALLKTFRFIMAHNGAGKMEVSVKLLKRGQKEVMIQCGRSYRFVVDSELPPESPEYLR